MKIDHIAIYVNDLYKARDFLLNILMLSPIMNITTRKPISDLFFSHLMMGQGLK